MADSPILGYRHLVTNPDRLGGKATVHGTRFSVSYDEIVRDYSEFPREALAEVLRFAAEVTDRRDVA